MQYKIPQDVQIEDKIVGPLTMKQLGICAAGGTITYFFYTTLAKNYYWEVWILPVGFTALLTLSVAFITIGNVSFTRFILLLVEHGLKPRKRLWKKGNGVIYESIFHPKDKNKVKTDNNIDKKVRNSKTSLDEIDQISKILNSQHTL